MFLWDTHSFTCANTKSLRQVSVVSGGSVCHVSVVLTRFGLIGSETVLARAQQGQRHLPFFAPGLRNRTMDTDLGPRSKPAYDSREVAGSKVGSMEVNMPVTWPETSSTF